VRVVLSGEGPTELGDWAKSAAYHVPPMQKGVLATLLERVLGRAVTVADAIRWRSIRKYKTGDHASPEARNVVGLALKAYETSCDALVFGRDRDGDEERESDVEDGIRRASKTFPTLAVIGGIAIENVEGWILVLCGDASGEIVAGSATKAKLPWDFGIETTEQKVDRILEADLDTITTGSLGTWLARARSVCAQFPLAPSSGGDAATPPSS
jgi:hypothetical protein